MSVVSDLCDAVAADLLANVNGLQGLNDNQVHLYLPVPEDEVALGQERHFGCWLLGDTAAPIMTETHERTQVYQVSIWENMAEAGARVVQDVEADLAFLDMSEETLDRFYTIANEMLAGNERTWPATVRYGSASGFIRKVAFEFTTKRLWAFN